MAGRTPRRARWSSASEKTNAYDVASSFVGRSGERERIAALFRGGARLVSLVATGGMGKTRIATRFARDHAADYSEHGGGGAWICDLTEVDSAAAISMAVASTLGILLRATTNEDETICELGRALADRKHLLVVLDNFEHVVKYARKTLGHWLRVATSARFLVTSRIALHVPGEHVLSLEGLELPQPDEKDLDDIRRSAPVALFLHRAQSVRSDRKHDDPDDLLRIRDIVRRLGGMPLAIELAAARTSILSIAQIHERLQTSLGLLVKQRDAGRHASMRRVIQDSYRLLDADERAAFSACAVFQGGFTLEAAEAVLGDAASSWLESLVAHSLLRVEGQGRRRFSMYETIRDFASEKWRKRADGPELARRHSVFFSRMSAALEMELENVVAAHEQAVLEATTKHSKRAASRALSLALALAPVFAARGVYPLRMRLLDEALRIAADDENDWLRAEALAARGQAYFELGEQARAKNDFLVALGLAKRRENKLIEAIAHLGLGELIEFSGNTAEARKHYAAALKSSEAAAAAPQRASLCRARAHKLLGHAKRREGDLHAARIETQRALALFGELDDDLGLAQARYEAAVIALFRRRYDEAKQHFDLGFLLAKKIGARDVEGAIETARGSMLQELGDVDGALSHHAAALLLFRELGIRTREGNTLYYLAGAHLENGDRAEAEKLLAHALGRVKGEHRYEALAYACRAVVARLSGDAEHAQRDFRAAEIAAKACKAEPTLSATVAIHRLHLAAISSPAQREKNLAAARAIAEAHACDDPRFAFRIFESADGSKDNVSLVVGKDGFRMPGKAFVDLRRRGPLRLLLAALAQKRIDAPGDALALEELLAAAWPGEQVQHEAAVNRVRVAIAALRKLGLREALLSAERGYLVSPVLSVLRR
jgi:predicted ATPase